jgi:hypothetical protein
MRYQLFVVPARLVPAAAFVAQYKYLMEIIMKMDWPWWFCSMAVKVI